VPCLLAMLLACLRALSAYLCPSRKGRWAVAEPVRTATQTRSVKFLKEERDATTTPAIGTRVRDSYQIATGGISTPGVFRPSDPEALDLDALNSVAISSDKLFGAETPAGGALTGPAEFGGFHAPARVDALCRAALC